MSIKIPLSRMDGFIWCLITIDNQDYLAMIDTGSFSSVMPRKIIEKYHIDETKRVKIWYPIGNRYVYGSWNLVQGIQYSGMSKKIFCPVIKPISKDDNDYNMHRFVTLSSEILTDNIVIFDLYKRRITMTSYYKSDKQNIISIKIIKNQKLNYTVGKFYIIPTKINNKEYNLIFDTGLRKGIIMPDAVLLKEGKCNIQIGKFKTTTMIKKSSLTHDAQYDGIIGLSVFENNRVIIDQKLSTISIE
jgi:hypothetical protein